MTGRQETIDEIMARGFNCPLCRQNRFSKHHKQAGCSRKLAEQYRKANKGTKK